MKRAAPIVLVILGLAQIAGDLTGVTALKAVAAATGASPAPKVFSAVKGFETYTSQFFIELRLVTDESTSSRTLEITPERYARVRGPYNRRNVFGAALAYAPVLPPELRDPVLRYAMCGDAPLLRELGIADAGAPWTSRVILVPLPGSSLEHQTIFEAGCR